MKRIDHTAKSCCIVETSAGFVALEYRDGKLLGVSFPELTSEAAAETLTCAADMATCAVTPEAELFKDYFAGKPVDFGKVDVDLSRFADFTVKVLEAVRCVPYGKTVSYKQLAQMVGSPLAARAVGQALGCNPVPIVVPCHRVLSSDGGLGGFSGGLEWKKRLLDLEGVHPKQ